MSSIETTTIGELGRVVTGKTPQTSRDDYFGGDIPFYTPSDMDGRKKIAVTKRTLTEAGAVSVKNCRIPAGAVMVSCIGSDMGKAAIASKDGVSNQQINTIIVKPDYCGEYIYYNLCGRQDELKTLGAGGSAQPILNKSDFSALEISVPPIDTQRRIAKVLGALDSKIDCLNEIQTNLHEMVSAVFRAWVVNPDSLNVNADSRPNSFMSGIRDLLPGTVEDSELGDIPTGWCVRALDEIAIFLNGLALQKYPPNGGNTLPVIKIAQLRKGDTKGAERCSDLLPGSYIVGDGDILFSWSGSLEVEVWCGGTGALNQHLFKVSPREVPDWFIYFWLRHHLPEFRLIAASKATTMGHIQRYHLSEAKALIPSAQFLKMMDDLVAPMFERIKICRYEIRTLRNLRDVLLPALMNDDLEFQNLDLVSSIAGA